MEYPLQQHAIPFWDVDMSAQFRNVPDEHLGITLYQRSGLDEICLVRLSENCTERVSTLAGLKVDLERREDLSEIDPRDLFVIVYRTTKKEGGKIFARLGTNESFGPDMILYHFNQLELLDARQLGFS